MRTIVLFLILFGCGSSHITCLLYTSIHFNPLPDGLTNNSSVSKYSWLSNCCFNPVSYTHLDVYKRQELYIKLLQIKFGDIVDKSLGQQIETYLPANIQMCIRDRIYRSEYPLPISGIFFVI